MITSVRQVLHLIILISAVFAIITNCYVSLPQNIAQHKPSLLSHTSSFSVISGSETILSKGPPENIMSIFRSNSNSSITASGATRCDPKADLIVGILSSPSSRSTSSRQAIRDTWLKFATPGHHVVFRFLLALNASGGIPHLLERELLSEQDILFLHTLEKYENLAHKVKSFPGLSYS